MHSYRRAIAAYLLIGLAWIWGSDWLLESWVSDPVFVNEVQTIKGSLFVLFTALVAYLVFRLRPEPDAVPSLTDRSGQRLPVRLGAAYALFAILLALLYALLYGVAHDTYHHQLQQRLSDMTDFKVRQIDSWLREREGDLQAVSQQPGMSAALHAWLRSDRQDDEQAAMVMSSLSLVREAYGYDSVSLLAPDRGEVIFAAGAVPQLPSVELWQQWREYASTVSLHANTREGLTLMTLMRPVQLQGEPLALLMMQAHHQASLYPVLRAWPWLDVAGYSLLLMPADNDQVCVNLPPDEAAVTLADHPQAIHVHVPRQDGDWRAQLMDQPDGVMDLRNGQGNPLMVGIGSIAGTPWRVATVIDRQAAFAGVHRLALAGLLVLVVLLAMMAVVLVSWLKRTRAEDTLREQFHENRYQYLSRYASDMILMANDQGQLLEANERACDVYGYTRNELLALTIRDLRDPATLTQLPTQLDQTRQAGQLVYETRHRRKDGSSFPVEIHGTHITLGQEAYFLAVIQDISDRKARDARIQRVNQLYQALSATNTAILRSDQLSGLLQAVCQAIIHIDGFALAWVGRAEGRGRIRLLAVAGMDKEVLQRALDRVSDLQDSMPWQVMQQRHLKVCQNCRDDGQLHPLMDMPLAQDWQSMACLPIHSPEGDSMVLSVAAVIPGMFDAEILALLSEMTGDIALGMLYQQQVRALADSERHFRAMFDNALIGLATTSPDKGWLDANPALCRLMGYDKAELMTKTWAELTHKDDLQADVAQFNRVLSGEIDAYNMDKRFIRQDGQVVYTHLTVQAVRSPGGRVDYIVASLEDIGARLQAEKDLQIAAQVFERSNEGIVITDADNNILMVNAAFERITGYAPAEVLGRNPRLLASGQHHEDFYRHMWQALLDTGHWEGEIINQRKNGEPYNEWLSVTLVRDVEGRVMRHIGQFSDITQRKRSEDRIAHLAHYDQLTGLPNRTLWHEHLQQALLQAARQQSSFVILYLDLDRFKNVNDSLGHEAGDQVLKQAAQRIEQQLRDEDLVARVGGDEFLMLLPATGNRGAARVADKLLQALAMPYSTQGQQFTLTSSIGIALYPGDGVDASTLVSNADAAMYAAKTHGRNQFQFYTASMSADILSGMMLETELRQGLAQQAFFLEYQPQYDLQTQQLVGFEALVRWQHPKRGRLMPGEFIPVAEASGIILPLGEWVLHEAMLQLKRWQQAGLTLIPVAVNLSAWQFRQPQLVSRLEDRLSALAVSPHLLELELTESVLVGDVQQALDSMHQLVSIGLRLSIDDFGTGYSSLSYLRQFPIDKLKIDQGFVRGIGQEPTSEAIIRTIVAMGHEMQLKVIAEGVETEEQEDFLRRLHCDQSQGFLRGKPLSVEEATQRLKPAE